MWIRSTLVVLLIAVAALAQQPAPASSKANATQEPPREWVDPATHHRIIRLSDEPGTASI